MNPLEEFFNNYEQRVENVSGLNELHIKFKIEEVLKRGVWGQVINEWRLNDCR